MEEFESQTEHVEEELHEHARHARQKWISGVALTAALLAALAASTSMMSAHFVDDAMLERMESADKWNEYGVKSIKTTIIESRIDEHKALGQAVNAKDESKLADYNKERKAIKDEAGMHADKSLINFRRHEVLARGVMLFQVAIAVSAISALTRRKTFWFIGIGLGIAGAGFLIAGFLPMYLHL